MPFSHHSHSGQFCNHAVDTLSSVLSTAATANFKSYSLTEHCPRGNSHLYPGEAEAGETYDWQVDLFDKYIAEATKLRKQYTDTKHSTKVLVGFEAEWIVADESEKIVRDILSKYGDKLDYFIGSVHHVCEITIDYNREWYVQARDAAGGTEEAIFLRYFRDQNQMLKRLKPVVVGHLDRIRLHADDPNRSWESFESVWPIIVENLEVARSYGGLLEINTSALRKGLKEPYPSAEIVRKWDSMGGLCVLSDDAHGIADVGIHYKGLLEFIRKVGLKQIAYLERDDEGGLKTRTMAVEELETLPYWNGVL